MKRNERKKQALSRKPLRLWRALQSYEDKTALLTLGSIALNAFTGASKLIVGVGAHSAWTTVNALYYLVLCAARAWTLHAYFAQKNMTQAATRRYRACLVYRHGGTFLCVIGVSYFLVCACMLFTDTLYEQRLDLAVFAALIALSKMALALWGVKLTRQRHGRVVQTLKMIAAADASVSVCAALRPILALALPRAAFLCAPLGMVCAGLFVFFGARMRARVLCVRCAKKNALRRV